MIAATYRADAGGFLAGHRFRMDSLAAKVAEFCRATDSREAVRTNSVQVALVQRKICPAKFTLQCAVRSRRPAMRAADNRRVMRARFLNREHLAAMTAETLANRQRRGVVLPFAVGTGDEKTHGHAQYGVDFEIAA